MSEAKKKRGRPLGKETDDNKELAAIADMVVANPTLRPTTAYKKVYPSWTDASVRRIQSKWRMRHEKLFAQAEQRRDERSKSEQRRGAEMSHAPSAGVRAAYLETETVYSQLKALQLLHDSPAARIFNQTQNSSWVQMKKALEDSSWVRIRKTTENNAFSRLANAMKSDHLYRLAEEQRRLQKLLNPFGSHPSPFKF